MNTDRKMEINQIKSVYFIGAGGIGMSALVRYFLSKGKIVAGYDRTPSELTEKLIEEGAKIHYQEDVKLIPEECLDKESTLVVLTPAIPKEHDEREIIDGVTFSLEPGIYAPDFEIGRASCRERV